MTAVALAITVAYVASAAVSTTHMAPSQLNAHSREYVDNLRADLRANPRSVLYDGYVPDDVMISWFGDERRVSTVLANAPENPIFDIPSRAMLIPDEDGRLRPMTLTFATDMVPAPAGDQCGYHVTSAGVTIPLQESVEADRWILRLGYFTNVETTMQITAGDDTQSVSVRRGVAVHDVVVSGMIEDVRLVLDTSPGTLCVTSLSVGYPQPTAPSGS